MREELRKLGIEFMTLEDLLEKVLRDMDEWVKRRRKLGLTKSAGRPMLPESWWLLKLIEYMKHKKIIRA